MTWICCRWSGGYATVHDTLARLDPAAATPPMTPAGWIAKPHDLRVAHFDRLGPAASWLREQINLTVAAAEFWVPVTADHQQVFRRLRARLDRQRAAHWGMAMPGGLAVMLGVAAETTMEATR